MVTIEVKGYKWNKRWKILLSELLLLVLAEWINEIKSVKEK